MRISAEARRWVFAPISFALVVSACDSPAAVLTDVDARETAQAMESMAAAGEDVTVAFASLSLAAPLFEGTTTAALLPSRDGLLASTRSLSPDVISEQIVFPANFLGVTFVYSHAEGRYVASDEPGAPSDGVRVIYYAVDPLNHEPVEPLNALGHIDLRDLDTPASSRLGIAVVRTAGGSNTTLADYYIDASFSVTQSAITFDGQAVGYLSNGTDRLNFDLNQAASLGEQSIVVTQDHEMALAGSDVSVAFQGELSADVATETGSYEVTSTIRNGGQTVVVDLLAQHDETLDGVIRFNGALFANIGGTFDAPTFTDANGDDIDAAQWAALEDIFNAVQSLIDLAESIFSQAE